MRRFRIVIVLLAVAAGVLLIAGFFMVRGPQPAAIALHFVMVTNSPIQGRVYVFAITNSSSREIGFFPAYPQVRADGMWPKELRLQPPPSTPQEYRAHVVGAHE